MHIVEYSERWIADRALTLINKYGQPFNRHLSPGFAQRAEREHFTLMYTTPFSGFVVIPGKNMYMVDIWMKNRNKVFSCAYETLDELSHKRPRKSDWLAQFHTLN